MTARIVLLDVNGTLTDPGPIGAPWGRPDLGERVLDAVHTFKPHPSVYAYALSELRASPAEVALLVNHPWDLAGAAHAGIATAWVTHGTRGWPGVFAVPDVTGDTLVEAVAGLLAGEA